MNENDLAKRATTRLFTPPPVSLLALVAVGAALSACSGPTVSNEDVESNESQLGSSDVGRRSNDGFDTSFDRGPDVRSDVRRECGEAPNGLEPRFTNVTRAGVTLRIATQGDRRKQALVLLHGFPDSWCGWGRVIPELSKRYFVVAPDLRGYNRSSKPGSPEPADVAPYALNELVADADAIIEFAAEATARSGKKPALIAHDWGAIIAWQYARNKGAALPTEIDRLLAVSVPHPIATSLMLGTPATTVLAVANSSPRKLDFGAEGMLTLGEWITARAGTDDAAKLAFIGAQQQAQGAALAYVQELIAPDAYANFSEDNYGPFFERLKTKLFHDPWTFWNEEERAAHVRMWERADSDTSQKSFQAMVKYYRANLATPLPYEFGVAGLPVSYVAPRYDGAINYPWGALGLERVAPTLTVQTVDSGHFVQREAPQKFIALVDDFVPPCQDSPSSLH